MFDPVRCLDTIAAHSGPYLFCVQRPHGTKKGRHTSEFLVGQVEDPISEAQALLTDPRDTINYVGLWSEREGQYVYGFRRKDFDA